MERTFINIMCTKHSVAGIRPPLYLKPDWRNISEFVGKELSNVVAMTVPLQRTYICKLSMPPISPNTVILVIITITSRAPVFDFLLLGCSECNRHCPLQSMIHQSVCLSVMWLCWPNMAEWTEVLLGVETLGNPKNILLDKKGKRWYSTP